MNHDVTPESSGAAAVAVAESPESELVTTQPVPSPEHGGALDTPGPISWDLPEGDPSTFVEQPGTVPAGEPDAEGAAEAPGEEPTADLMGEAQPGAATPPAPAVWSLGPVGRSRHLGLLTLLSVLTVGLSTIVWFARANREMREFDPRMHVRPGRSAVAIAVPVMASWIVGAAAGARLLVDHLGYSVDLPLSAKVTAWFVVAPLAAPWLALLLPFSIVAVAMTVERVRVSEDRAGTAPDLQARPIASLRWLLIPAFGIVVLVIRTQARLNRVWSIARP
jgi:hypothetical protein